MRDMFKFVDKNRLIIVFAISIIQSAAAYAVSFCFSYFATSPLTINKLYQLLTSLLILYIIALVINWLFIHFSQMFLFKIEYFSKKSHKDSENLESAIVIYLLYFISTTFTS